MFSLITIDAVQLDQPARRMMPDCYDNCRSLYAIWRNQLE
jgi:hypothetical protein